MSICPETEHEAQWRNNANKLTAGISSSLLLRRSTSVFRPLTWISVTHVRDVSATNSTHPSKQMMGGAEQQASELSLFSGETRSPRRSCHIIVFH